MSLLVGTGDGLYAGSGREFAPVASDTDVRGFARERSEKRYYAATDRGLLVAEEPRETWERVDGPPRDLWSVAVTPTGDVVVGAHDPAELYRSSDGGTWVRNDRFADLPGFEEWDNLAAGSSGRARTIAVHPDAPHRVAVGVEAEGVWVSEDGGRSWERRSRGLNRDVHHLLVRGPGEYVAACGRGLYRTTDAGRSWTALDTHRDQFWYTYYRATLDYRGRLLACGQDRSQARFADEAESRVLVSEDEGRTFRLERFPGCEDDYVNAWAVHEGRPVAGTHGGRILERGDGEWVERGSVPGTVRALATVE